MISQHWTQIDAQIRREHSSLKANFVLKLNWKLILARIGYQILARMPDSRENVRFSWECPNNARMRGCGADANKSTWHRKFSNDENLTTSGTNTAAPHDSSGAETSTLGLQCPNTAVSPDVPSTTKGLRDRNSPTCTLSQNGYGVEWWVSSIMTSHDDVRNDWGELISCQKQPSSMGCTSTLPANANKHPASV